MRAIWFLLLGLLVLVVAACSAPAAIVPDEAELTLVAEDIAYDQTRLEVVAGQTVRLTLENNGVLVHDFTIMEMPVSGEVRIMGANHDMAGADHMEHMDGGMAATMPGGLMVHVAAEAGGQGTVEFTPSEPGEYEYYCAVAGHKEAGMVGTLVVKSQ